MFAGKPLENGQLEGNKKHDMVKRLTCLKTRKKAKEPPGGGGPRSRRPIYSPGD